jgi:cysteine desulfurase
VALAAGMAIALEICHRDLADSHVKIAQLRDRLQLGLQESCAPVVINGSLEHRLPNTLNISFPGVDGEALLIALDLDGVACSLGSTCASGSAEPAPVLVAMGCPADVYSSAVRFSTGRDTTGKHIDAAVLRISNLVNRLRASSD